jgi:hypothetical protein
MRRAQPRRAAPPAPGRDAWRADIAGLNLAWLLAARQAAQSDTQEAALVFGLDRELRDRLCTASLDDLRRLARSGLLLFRPRFPEPLRQECAGEAGGSALGPALQSILLAAEEVAPR